MKKEIILAMGLMLAGCATGDKACMQSLPDRIMVPGLTERGHPEQFVAVNKAADKFVDYTDKAVQLGYAQGYESRNCRVTVYVYGDENMAVMSDKDMTKHVKDAVFFPVMKKEAVRMDECSDYQVVTGVRHYEKTLEGNVLEKVDTIEQVAVGRLTDKLIKAQTTCIVRDPVIGARQEALAVTKITKAVLDEASAHVETCE